MYLRRSELAVMGESHQTSEDTMTVEQEKAQLPEESAEKSFADPEAKMETEEQITKKDPPNKRNKSKGRQDRGTKARRSSEEES